MSRLLSAFQIVIALLALNAWLTPRHLLQWKFSLLVLGWVIGSRCSHW